MQFTYATHGTCARFIDIELADQNIRSVTFVGGCRGNLEAISRLVQSKNLNDIIPLLRGVICRNGTSCSDQLAQALSGPDLRPAS